MGKTEPYFSQRFKKGGFGHVDKQNNNSQAQELLFVADQNNQQADKNHCHSSVFGLVSGNLFCIKPLFSFFTVSIIFNISNF